LLFAADALVVDREVVETGLVRHVRGLVVPPAERDVLERLERGRSWTTGDVPTDRLRSPERSM
jgi:hypothetical protein